MSTTEENTQVNIVRKEFILVVSKCLLFMLVIAKKIKKIEHDGINKRREKRKFLAIKKELFNFLFAHKKFYNIDRIIVQLEDSSLVYEKSFSITQHGNDFLKLEDILKLNEVHKGSSGKIRLSTEFYKDEIINTIRLKQKKSVLTKQDVQQFLESNLLIEKSDFNTKCSTYADLQNYIKIRNKDYYKKIISAENINQMSFRFEGSIEDNEDEEKCPVCLYDYETDQEVCRLPCNHFCCRDCTEIMFSTPNEGLQSNIFCPICRDDCT